jgi:hypothetical protein
MHSSYVDVISTYFPKVYVSANGDGFEYDDLVWQGGDPIPLKSVLDPLCLELAQDRVWRMIQAERDKRKAGGIKVGSSWFHSDDTSRIQHIGLLLMGANMPANIMWKTMGGTFVNMTPTLAQQIFSTMSISDMTIFGIAEQHRARMLQAPVPAAYDFSTGWPKIFGE